MDAKPRTDTIRNAYHIHPFRDGDKRGFGHTHPYDAATRGHSHEHIDPDSKSDKHD